MRRLGERYGLLAGAWVAIPSLAFAATIRVPEDQPTIAAAIAVAQAGDIVRVQSSAFNAEPLIDYNNKAVRIESVSSLSQPNGGLYLLATNAELAATSSNITIRGELRSPATGSADAVADGFQLDYGGRIAVLAGARLNIVSDYQPNLDGSISVAAGGQLWVSTPGSSATLNGGLVLYDNAQFNISSGLNLGASVTGLNATFSAGGNVQHYGRWIMAGGRIVAGSHFTIGSSGTLTLYGGELTLGGVCNNGGSLRVFDGLVLGQDFTNNAGSEQSELLLHNTMLVGGILTNNGGAEVMGCGAWYIDLRNHGNVIITADTTLTGDTDNFADGLITVQAGTLTLFGTLTNDGTIVGDFGPALRADGGFVIHGAYLAGPEAGLSVSGAQLRVDGDYAVATADNTRYDLRSATLVLGSLAGSQVSFELMSTDEGPSPAGLDRTQPGHYPIGTLHIAGGTVHTADVYDNDGLGQEQCEALYVDTLQIDAGATLETYGCHIYYNTLINDGTIVNPEDVRAIGPLLRGDMNCDGIISYADVNPFVVALQGPAAYEVRYPNCEWLNADVNGDDVVSYADINAFVRLLNGRG